MALRLEPARFLVLSSLWAAPALADVPGLTLNWQAPAGCPSQEQLERAVLAGRLDRQAAPGRQVQAAVVVERRDDGSFIAQLTTIAPEGRGTRQLEGESCDAIAAASAVVLALALDAQPPAAPEPPAPPPPPPPEPAPSPPSPPPPRFVPYVHAFGGGVLRALPEPAALFGLGVGATRGRYDFELLLGYSFEQVARADSPPGAHAELGRLSAQLIACLAPVHSRTAALEVCAGVLGERLHGTSRGVSHPASESAFVLGPELGLRSRLRVLPRWHLLLDVTGFGRLSQPRFVIGNVGQVHEMPTFDGMLQAGLLLDL